MPESVKISELPPLSTVQPNDIVPVVDEYLTQTSRATAAQIAAIGGGPPGANTVSTEKIQDNAVTAVKCAFTGPDKLFSRTATGAGSGVEIDCTPYARGLLSSANGAAARTYLDALQTTNNPVFSGQVQVGRGQASIPAIAPSADPATGIFFPQSEAMSVAAGGQEVFRLQSDGTILARATEESILRPRYAAVAWVTFNGLSTAGANYDIFMNPGAIAQRYGLTGAIMANDVTTRNYLKSVETARGLTLSYPGPTALGGDFLVAINSPASYPSGNAKYGQFADKYGKGDFAEFCHGTEDRANYTTPGDNVLWRWNGSAWVTNAASGNSWLGSIRLTTPVNSSPFYQSRGIAAITRSGLGQYSLLFTQPMYDTNYAVFATTDDGNSNAYFVRVVSRTVNQVNIAVQRTNTTTVTYFDPTYVAVSVFR